MSITSKGTNSLSQATPESPHNTNELDNYYTFDGNEYFLVSDVRKHFTPTSEVERLIVEARIDELEKLLRHRDCLRPWCKTEHTYLTKLHVKDRITHLKESLIKDRRVK